jgi:hypothetical protein
MNIDKETILLIAGAGGFALGLLVAIGLGVSLCLKHRGHPDSSGDA